MEKGASALLLPVSARRQLLDVHAVRRAKHPLKRAAEVVCAWFEGLEDAAAVVVGHHDRQVARARFARADDQTGRVVHEGQVAHQGDGPRAGLIPVTCHGGTDRRRIGPVDTRDPAVREDPHPVGDPAGQGDVPDGVAGADDELVAGGHGVADRPCDVEPGGRARLVPDAVELAGELSMALMWVLERLAPEERAEFLQIIVRESERLTRLYRTPVDVLHVRDRLVVVGGDH